MKSAAKVFIWIGMIIQCVLIYPIIIGFLALRKIESATSKNELQSIGIITTLFCSLLGGVFMLCLNENDLSSTPNLSSSPNGIITYKKTFVENHRNPDLDKAFYNARIIIIVLVYTLLISVLTSLPFSILALNIYYGLTSIPMIIASTEILIIAIFLLFYIRNKHTLSSKTEGLIIGMTCLSVLQLVFCTLSNYVFAYNGYGQELYYSNITNDYYYDWQYKIPCYEYPEYWVIFGIAFLTLTLSLFILFLSKKTKQTRSDIPYIYKKEKKVIITSNLELELLEVKRLLDNGTITNQEYDNLRSKITDKYYK